MSGTNKYSEQFDRNAGQPADFDSLFRFEGEELIAKKKIRMRSSKKRIAAMTVSAAAVAGAAFIGLSYISSAGLSSQESGICELAEMSAETSTLSLSTGNEENTEYYLSELFSQSEYYTPYVNTEEDYPIGEYSLESADIILRCRVVSKEHSAVFQTSYELCPLEYYFTDNYSDTAEIDPYTLSQGLSVSIVPFYTTNESEFNHISEFDSIFTLKGGDTLNGGLNELQIGYEYIIPLNMYKNGGENTVIWNSSAVPIKKSSAGWLFDESCYELTKNAQGVVNDMQDKCTNAFFLESSDEKLFEEINTVLGSSEKKYYHIYTDYFNEETITEVISDEESESVQITSETVYSMTDIFGGEYGEKLIPTATETTENGQTVLYFDGSAYPDIRNALLSAGNYLYSGTNAAGENMVVIKPESSSAYTVMLIGMSRQLISDMNSADISENSDSGTFRMICFDEQGRPMSVDSGIE